MCPLCGGTEETVEHVVRNCPLAREIWCRMLGEDAVRQNEMAPFDVWMCRNIEGTTGLRRRETGMVFAIIVWWIWRWRNDVVFNGVVKNIEYKVCFLLKYISQVREAISRRMNHQREMRPPVDREDG